MQPRFAGLAFLSSLLSLPLSLSPLIPQFRFRFEYRLLSVSEKWGLDLHLEGTVFQSSLSLSPASPMGEEWLLDKVYNLGL